MMNYYHFTSCYHLQQILKTKEIKTTCSNLLKPINPHIVNGVLVDETDIYKPVVWLTDHIDFDRALQCGLAGSAIDKTEAVIVVDNSPHIKKWSEWAIANNINTEWFNLLKQTAPEWQSFYISEEPIKITDKTKIAFRPDIAAAMV